MITRIVKMSFDTDKIETFIEIFANAKSKIAAFPGCSGVTLYRDILHSHLFLLIVNGRVQMRWKNTDNLYYLKRHGQKQKFYLMKNHKHGVFKSDAGMNTITQFNILLRFLL